MGKAGRKRTKRGTSLAAIQDNARLNCKLDKLDSSDIIKSHPGFRIIVLGAGFSRPAGLPLGNELFGEVCSRIRECYGNNTKFEHDLKEYIEYREACDGHAMSEKNVDLEDFMSFLDVEHFMDLRGSDTWSQEGNESQLMIRNALGFIIQSRTPTSNHLPDCYYQFAENVSAHDTVLTLNYDIVLERAFEHVGKPYRLFTHRFKTIGKTANEVDNSIEEVTLLKLHGSVDWFDDRHYLELKEILSAQGSSDIEIHPIFDNPDRYVVQPIVQGLRAQDDPLLHIHRIREVDSFYQEHGRRMVAPFILSPSHVKFVYSNPLHSFWHGMGRSGGYNLGVTIVGFSMPKHDDYIRIGLYQMISNYQQSWWNDKFLGLMMKDNVKVVDYCVTKESIAKLKSRYRFLDAAKTDYFLDGFSHKAIEFIFSQTRKT
jgi:hypothetical protein